MVTFDRRVARMWTLLFNRLLARDEFILKVNVSLAGHIRIAGRCDIGYRQLGWKGLLPYATDFSREQVGWWHQLGEQV